jgi:hypothetical protein
MAGAVEEGAKVAAGFMDALKREPLSLALVVMNMALLAFFYVLLTRVADQREREINLLYADKKEVRELLSKCVVPERRTEKPNASIVRLPLPDLPPISPLPLGDWK